VPRIASFGDSFIFGSELPCNLDGSRAWPGLAAQQLGVDYDTRAIPGCGNDRIAQQIYSYFQLVDPKEVLAVVNWTWIFRWDVYLQRHDSWITLGPTCVAQTLPPDLEPIHKHQLIDMYQTMCHDNVPWNQWRNLNCVSAVQRYLEARQIRSVQTYMDPTMMDQQHAHGPGTQCLQQALAPVLEDFQGHNFLDWSRSRGYAVTDPGWHPLEQAHAAACDLWVDHYDRLLTS